MKKKIQSGRHWFYFNTGSRKNMPMQKQKPRQLSSWTGHGFMAQNKFVWNWKCSERRIFLPNMKSLWTALLSIWNEACHKMTPLLGCEKIYHCRGKKSRKNSLVVSTILNNISNSLDKTTRGMRASFFKKLHHSAAGKFRQQSSFSYFPSGTRTKDTVLFCTKVVRFDFVGRAFQIDRWYGHDKSVRFVSGRSLFEFD